MSRLRQKGVTLIELMVSLIIGLIVAGVVTGVFLSNRASFQLQESMARVQESGRLALQYMADEIRHAGNGLESSIGQGMELCMLAEDRCNSLSTRAVHGRVGNGTNEEVAGSDILTLGRADTCDALVAGEYKPNTANFKATKYCPSMRQNGILLLTDFKRAVIFEVNNSPNNSPPVTINHAGPGNVVSNKLGEVEFDPGARVLGFSNVSFFIRETSAADMSGNPVRTLAVRNNLQPGNPVTDIIDGVEQMRVYYGIPSAGQIVYRRSAQMASADWERVTAVRLELLMISDTAARDAESQAVTFDGQPVPADGRLRQVYRTLVAIRGRI